MRHLFSRCLAGLALLAGLMLPPVSAMADALPDRVAALGGHPCDLGALTCVTLTVPVDPENPGTTMDVEFAVHFANNASKGILVYVVGGPGGSGLAVADDYLAAFDARLADEMDVVFFDQRGTGPLSGLTCAAAQVAFDQADLSTDRPDAAITAAQDFVTACLAEIDHADLLPFVDTNRAIGDLEAFRVALGSPKVWLYGESYGTQYVQQYAVRYPAAVSGVVIDGVVDLALDSDGFYLSALTTTEALLQRTDKAAPVIIWRRPRY